MKDREKYRDKDKDKEKETEMERDQVPRTITSAVPPKQPERLGGGPPRLDAGMPGGTMRSGPYREDGETRFTGTHESRRVSQSGYSEEGHRQTGHAASVETIARPGEVGPEPEPVERERWRETLDRFSHRNSGRAVTLESRGARESEYRADVTDTVLGGVAMSGSTPRDLSVSILMGTDSSRHATHTISPVRELLLLRSRKGIEQGLEIVSANDVRTRLVFSGS